MRRNQPGHWVLDLGRNAVDHHTKGHTSSTPSCENHRSHHCSFAHPDDRHNSWCTSSRSPGSTLRGNDMRNPHRQERITRTCWHTCGLALRNVRVLAPLKPSSRSRHGTTAGGGAGPILSLKHSSNHSAPGKRDTPHATLVSSMTGRVLGTTDSHFLRFTTRDHTWWYCLPAAISCARYTCSTRINLTSWCGKTSGERLHTTSARSRSSELTP